jgi:hypothetical protein
MPKHERFVRRDERGRFKDRDDLGRPLTRAFTAALVLLSLAGCASQPSPTSEVSTTSPTEATTAGDSIVPPPSFTADEVAAEVAAEMQSECLPAGDELLCSVVVFEGITFANGVLSVPTTLDAEAGEDAEHVCSFFTTANMDQATGALFGIETIDILSADGAVVASCESEI